MNSVDPPPPALTSDHAPPERDWSPGEERALRLWIALARCYATFAKAIAVKVQEYDLTTPQFGRHSASRSVFGWLTPKAEYDLDARINGGPRNIVNISAWEKVTGDFSARVRSTSTARSGDIAANI